MTVQVQGVAFKQTPHPVLAEITLEQALALGEARTRELLIQREEIITREKENPLLYGFEPENWKDADEQLALARILCIFGGNRAGKTRYVVRRAMKLLATRPDVKVLFLHNNALSSEEIHQQYCWEDMPPEWKNAKHKRGGKANIKFDPKTKFADSKWTSPLGGTCIYGNYGQELRKYEGFEFDAIVADEFMPLMWFRALLRGLATRNGWMMWAFTPLEGMSPAVAEVAAGARTLKSKPVDPEILSPTERHVDDCAVGHMPYIAEKGKVRIMYFHSADNPFGGFQALKDLYIGASKTEREQRFYGFARKLVRVQFPKFGQAHRIPAAKMSEILKGPVTRYHIADPASARNMFQIWVAVDPEGRHFIYREWPDVPRFGEWAVASEDAKKWDGEAGPAQATLGMGVIEMKEMMLTAEGHVLGEDGWKPGEHAEDVMERYMDPRSGAAQSVAERDGGSSLMDRFGDEQRNSKGVLVGPSMIFQAAPGFSESAGVYGNSEGIQGINDLLNYDTTQPVTAFLNEPKLFVSDACENVIWALLNYTGNDGAKAACKDPIDVCRYMATSDLMYVDSTQMHTRGGGGY